MNNTSKLSLAELNKMYLENRDSFENIRHAATEKPKTFRILSLAEGAALYEKVGKERYKYYAENPTEEIVELRTSRKTKDSTQVMLQQRSAELEILRQQLELERQQIELEGMRIDIEQKKKELGLE